MKSESKLEKLVKSGKKKIDAVMDKHETGLLYGTAIFGAVFFGTFPAGLQISDPATYAAYTVLSCINVAMGSYLTFDILNQKDQKEKAKKAFRDGYEGKDGSKWLE